MRRVREIIRDRLPFRLAELLAPNRWVGVSRCAARTTDPLRFALREGLAPAFPGRRGALRGYTMKTSGLHFWLRQGTADLGIFIEIFVDRVYDLPGDVLACLERSETPRVLDLGGHIGLAGISLLEQLPGARIVAFEPDPDNFRILQRCIRSNGLQQRWQARERGAGASDGAAHFSAGLSSSSKLVARDEPSEVTVAVTDVLPEISTSDLVKMDMEGAEWAILGDPRFQSAAPEVLVMEYHSHLCPAAEPRSAASDALHRAGYEVRQIFDEPEQRVGMMWAVRFECARRGENGDRKVAQ